MLELLIGSGNPQKIKHYSAHLRDIPYKLLTPLMLGITEFAPETGKTLEENALSKAKFYFAKTGLPTLSEDAGFEIPALGNFPGVLSKRFLGNEMTDEKIIAGILQRMVKLEKEKRKARMRIAIVLLTSPNIYHTATASIEGVVPKQPFDKIISSFPYRSLLYVTALNKWFYDVTHKDEEKLGYRTKAIIKLKKYLI